MMTWPVIVVIGNGHRGHVTTGSDHRATANPRITVPAPEPELFLSTEYDMKKLVLSES